MASGGGVRRSTLLPFGTGDTQGRGHPQVTRPAPPETPALQKAAWGWGFWAGPPAEAPGPGQPSLRGEEEGRGGEGGRGERAGVPVALRQSAMASGSELPWLGSLQEARGFPAGALPCPAS